MRLLRLARRVLKRALILFTTAPFLMLTHTTRFIYVSEAISLIPLRFGEQVRYEFYRRRLAGCGRDVTIGFGTIVSYPDVTMGNEVWIDSFCNIGHADLLDHVLVARNCHIVSGSAGHPFDRTDMPIIHQQGVSGRVHVGPDVWLGSGAIVLANIGTGCVVGAGSVVVRDVPDWAVAAGVPARVLRSRRNQGDQHAQS